MSNADQLIDDIPEYGSAFVCGKSRFEEGKFHVRDDPIVQLSCGDEHTGVVTERGRVFMFGSNNWGQLGLGHENNVEKPSCIKSIKHEKSILIACGRNHTLVATEEGSIYSFGCNSESQLGLGDDESNPFYSTPQKIRSIDAQNWLMLAAGAGQSCALTKSGLLYVWGINDNGELGLGKISEQNHPRLLDLNFKISYVACGYYHTAIVSKKGVLYTAGSNEYFQLGRDNQDSRRFYQVDALREPISSVSCGGGHTVAITDSGRAWSFGDGTKGQLGNGSDIQKSMPEPIDALRKLKLVRVSCGECHTAFITKSGEMYACGDNRYGKLGLNQKTYNSIQFTPVIVQKFRPFNVENVSCGGCHMILVAKVINDRRDDYDNDRRSLRGSRSDLRYENNNSRSKYNSSNLSNSQKSSSKNYDSSSENLRKFLKKKQESDSESVNSEAERTFNRTHTLTRENKFVPLSEINLKKKIADEEDSKYNHKSHSKDSKAYMNYSSSRSQQNENKHLQKLPNLYGKKNMSDESSDSDYDSFNQTYTKNNSRNSKQYPNSKPFHNLSDDDDSDYAKPKSAREKENFRSSKEAENSRNYSKSNEPSYSNNKVGTSSNSKYDSVTNNRAENEVVKSKQRICVIL